VTSNRRAADRAARRSRTDRTVGRGDHRLGEGVLHEYHADWPPRLVLRDEMTVAHEGVESPFGDEECERCDVVHRIWVTDDAIWALVPDAWRGERLCLDCFEDVT
jgi:hypothetical protein